MPTPTYTPLANITLGSSTTSVTFSSISGAYRDLILVTNLVSAGTYASANVRFNSDTGSNYTSVFAVDGPSSFTSSSTSQGLFWSGWAVNGNIMSVTQIMDYSATDKHKTTLVRTAKFDSEGNGAGMIASRWASTSAITSLQVYSAGTYGNPFAAGTTLMLYGVAA